MDGYDRPRTRSNFGFKPRGVERERIGLDVHKDGPRAEMDDGPHLVGGGAHLYACRRSGQPFAPWEGSHCSAWDARRTMGSGSSRSEAGGTRTGAGTARTGEAVVLASGPFRTSTADACDAMELSV